MHTETLRRDLARKARMLAQTEADPKARFYSSTMRVAMRSVSAGE